MKYTSSCKAISIWEDICKSALKSGKVTVAHDGRSENNDSCFTRRYNVHLKSTFHPVEVKFVYDSRENSDKASIKISLYDLVLILEALVNKEFNLDSGNLAVSMTKEEGLTITEK